MEKNEKMVKAVSMMFSEARREVAMENHYNFFLKMRENKAFREAVMEWAEKQLKESTAPVTWAQELEAIKPVAEPAHALRQTATKELLLARGLTFDKLSELFDAEGLKISPRVIKQWFLRYKPLTPKLEQIKALAKILNVSFSKIAVYL